MANDTVYMIGFRGLDEDLKCAHRMTRGIKAGTVWVNTYSYLDNVAPFGGTK
ncbi:aldehyde dehydrogenase family protein [Peribacillus frigoritolerans]|uniref:aldehyde dehydrogenase family protein n=1 Tax=Peribacillus frigoritolerans TaxID=450367 RepID=UPI0022828D92|nr:aldehyde dehydrogenase family protein [Peribacillus frigoritolerans]MCY9140428.1 aldehyde dehydrogenase family protein [Peribacillus frigoritolerans]